MTSLAAVILCAQSTLTVSDFFPLEKGMTWVYQDSSEGSAVSGEDSVGNSQPIGGKDAIPIVTKFNGKVDGATFYRVDGDQVLVVAFAQNKPLEQPYPIIVFGSGKDSWTFTGNTQWFGTPAPMVLKGTARRSGKKNILGNQVETLTVTLEAVIGSPENPSMKSKQVSVYAKGIGLAELKDTMTINKSKTERKRTLSKFATGSK